MMWPFDRKRRLETKRRQAVANSFRQLAGDVQDLVAKVQRIVDDEFGDAGPLFSEDRRAIICDWLANFARNLDAVAAAVETGKDMHGQPITFLAITDSTVTMLGDYHRHDLLDRLEQVCGKKTRKRFEGILCACEGAVKEVMMEAANERPMFQ